MACLAPSWLKLNVRIAPKVVPMHGVHPAAKNTPIMPDDSKLYGLDTLHCGRLSLLSQGIFSNPSVINPKPITTTPPTWPIVFLYSLKTWPNTVTVPPHPRMNTTEKPATNIRAWMKVLNLLRKSGVDAAKLGEFVSWVEGYS